MFTKNMFQLLGFDVKEVHVVAGMRNEPAHERKDLHCLEGYRFIVGFGTIPDNKEEK